MDRLTHIAILSACRSVRLATFCVILLVLSAPGPGHCRDQAATSETAVSAPGDRWVQGEFLWAGPGKSPFKKIPALKGDPACGEARLGPVSVRFAVFGYGDKKSSPTLIFDLNQNLDLTDDPAIALAGEGGSKTLKLDLPGGSSIKARLLVESREPPLMMLYPVEGHRIRVNLGGREYDALLRDSSFDGLKQGASTDDFMMVDLNGDGRFDDGPGGMQPEGFTYLGNLVWLNGDLWLLTLDSKTPAVSLRPYSGASGQLALEIDLPEPWKEAGLLARLTGTSGFLSPGAARTVVSLSKPAPIRLPAVSYSYLTLALSVQPKGQPAQVLDLSAMGDKLRIENGKTLTLKIAAPKSISVKVQQMGRTLSITKGETRAGDLDWGSMISTLLDTPGAAGGKSAAPTARIYPGGQSGASPIGEGTMEYG